MTDRRDRSSDIPPGFVRAWDEDKPNTMTAPSEPPAPIWHAASEPFTPACGTTGARHFTTPHPLQVTCTEPACATIRLRSMN